MADHFGSAVRTLSQSSYIICYTLEDGGEQTSITVSSRKLNVPALKEQIGFGITELMEVGNETYESFLPTLDGKFALPFSGTYLAVLDLGDPFVAPLCSNISHHDITVAQALIEYARGDRLTVER